MLSATLAQQRISTGLAFLAYVVNAWISFGLAFLAYVVNA